MFGYSLNLEKGRTQDVAEAVSKHCFPTHPSSFLLKKEAAIALRWRCATDLFGGRGFAAWALSTLVRPAQRGVLGEVLGASVAEPSSNAVRGDRSAVRFRRSGCRAWTDDGWDPSCVRSREADGSS